MTSTALKPIDAVRSDITKMSPQFKAALPSHVNAEKFQRVLVTAVQQTPALLDCDRGSLYGAAMRAAQDGLLPDGREGAIVTFSGKAQWMPMVAGIMKKVRNSGEISTWSVQVVKANDNFDYQLGDDEKIIHKPALRDRGETIGAYSIVTMKDGEKSREFMDVDQIKSIQMRSRSANAGPWKTDWDEMAKKTVVRRHSKRLPMSTDLDELLRQDDDLFMPPSQEATPAPRDVTPAAEQTAEKPSRPTRLKKVVEMEATTVDEEAPEPDYIPPGEPVQAEQEYPI
jgi:recombination protein RecT